MLSEGQKMFIWPDSFSVNGIVGSPVKRRWTDDDPYLCGLKTYGQNNLLLFFRN